MRKCTSGGLCLSFRTGKKKSLLLWFYLPEQTEFLEKSTELHPYIFREPVLSSSSFKLFYIVSFVKKTNLFFCPTELIDFLTNQCTPETVNFRIPVNTIVQKRVDIAGLRSLLLKRPACKVGLWLVFGNLAFLTFPDIELFQTE